MFKSLQAGRAIAAILVMLCHVGGAIASEKYFGISGFRTAFGYGSGGVEFFFVLSGFIIYYAHRNDLSKPGKIKSYVLKRTVRVYPIYWIVFLVAYGGACLSPATREQALLDPVTFVKSLLLVPQNPEVVGGSGAPVLGVAWTLQYEMMFYAAFGLAIISRIAGVGLICCFVVAKIVSATSGGLVFPWSFVLSDYIYLFIFGIVVACVVLRREIGMRAGSVFLYAGVAGCVVHAVSTMVDRPMSKGLEVPFLGLSSAAVVLGMVVYEKHGRAVLAHRFFQLFGDASYSLYLIHFPVITILCKVSMRAGLKGMGFGGAMIAFVVMVVCCMVAGVVLHKAVEKPITGYLRRLTRPAGSDRRVSE